MGASPSLRGTSEALAEPIGHGATLLREFAEPRAATLMRELHHVITLAPFRHMVTRGGFRMSVAMTSCGESGWVSDRGGYRYAALDPVSKRPWPPMPRSFSALAAAAADAGGFNRFAPDTCLINRYAPTTRLALHQDKDERDFDEPIVSISLGLPAVFLFGGLSRRDKPRRVELRSGDVAVWGGPTRLAFHGVAPLAPGVHHLTGRCRINLTFRKAG